MAETDTDKTVKLLEMHYQDAINQSGAKDFFIRLAEYVKLVLENKGLNRYIEELQRQSDIAYAVFNKIDMTAVRELEAVYKKVDAQVKKMQIDLKPVNRALEEIKMFNNDRLWTSMDKAHFLDNNLFYVAKGLKEGDHLDVIKDCIDDDKEQKNIYGNFTFSETLPERDKAKDELNRERSIEVWGAWEELPFVYRSVFEIVDMEKELKDRETKGKIGRWELANFMGVKSEFNRVVSEESKEESLIYFKPEEFKKRLERVHKYLIKELISDVVEDEKSHCSFNEATSTLVINEKKIKFRKHTEQYHTLRIIFENENEVSKEWFFSEIGEKMDRDKGYTDKQFHNYISAISRRIASETSIKDFFITTNQSVRINDKFFR